MGSDPPAPSAHELLQEPVALVCGGFFDQEEIDPWPVFESHADLSFFGFDDPRPRRPVREGALEIEAMATDLRIGVAPRAVPAFLRRLAEEEGGVVHSAEAASAISEVFRAAAVRLFAVDMLATGLGFPEGRAMAAAALCGTKFADCAQDSLRGVYERLLAPEDELTFREMGRLLSAIPATEIRKTAPTLFLAMRVLMHLPALAGGLFSSVLIDGVQLPRHLAHAISPGAFVGENPMPSTSNHVCQVSLQATRGCTSDEQLAAAAMHCWTTASGGRCNKTTT